MLYAHNVLATFAVASFLVAASETLHVHDARWGRYTSSIADSWRLETFGVTRAFDVHRLAKQPDDDFG
jgi:hypothetical protein